MKLDASDKQKRHPPVPEAYPTNEALVWERMLSALGNIFGTPKGAISTDFRERMEKVFKKEYPNLRCSTARALFEGRIEGIPKPLSDIPPAWKKLLQQALSVLDMFETMAEVAVAKKKTPQKTSKVGKRQHQFAKV